MAAKSHLFWLHHILEAIDDIRSMTTGSDTAALESDRRTRLALERAFEIVSEASRHLPDDLKPRHIEIPRKQIASIGNRLRHEYHNISPAILSQTAHQDLPPLEHVCKIEMERERRREQESARKAALNEPKHDN